MTSSAYELGRVHALRKLGFKFASDEEQDIMDQIVKEKIRNEIIMRRSRGPILAGLGIGTGAGGATGALLGGMLGNGAGDAIGGGLAGAGLGSSLGVLGGALYGHLKNRHDATREAEKAYADMRSGNRKGMSVNVGSDYNNWY